MNLYALSKAIFKTHSQCIFIHNLGKGSPNIVKHHTLHYCSKLDFICSVTMNKKQSVCSTRPYQYSYCRRVVRLICLYTCHGVDNMQMKRGIIFI